MSRWCAALLLMAAQAAQAASLEVCSATGERLLRVVLDNAPCWSLRWNHSVTGIRVEDYYCLRDERMVLIASHTPAFDAGLGHVPGRGRLESDGRHGYWIRGIDEPVPGNGYWLRVGSAAVNHRIVHDGHIVSLSQRAAGQRMRIRIVNAMEPEHDNER